MKYAYEASGEPTKTILIQIILYQKREANASGIERNIA